MGWVSNPGTGGIFPAQSSSPLQTSQIAGNAVLTNKLLSTDANPAFQILGDGTLSWGAGAGSATDMSFARVASATMRMTGGLTQFQDTAGNIVVSARTGSGATWYVDSNGKIQWSSAGGSLDTNLYRSAGGALKTDFTFQALLGQVSPTAVSVNGYVAGQAPATSTQGTDTTPVSGTIFYGQVFVPANVTLTGISYLIGTVGGTNNVIVALYNNAGTLVANSATAGTLVGTLATMQRVPFTSTYAAIGPAMYWVSVSMNGTTARLRTHTFGDHPTGSATGVFGTLGAIAPPTTFTANTAPYATTY